MAGRVALAFLLAAIPAFCQAIPVPPLDQPPTSCSCKVTGYLPDARKTKVLWYVNVFADYADHRPTWVHLVADHSGAPIDFRSKEKGEKFCNRWLDQIEHTKSLMQNAVIKAEKEK